MLHQVHEDCVNQRDFTFIVFIYGNLTGMLDASGSVKQSSLTTGDF